MVAVMQGSSAKTAFRFVVYTDAQNIQVVGIHLKLIKLNPKMDIMEQ